MSDTRSGFVVIVGRPNVGKSTLVNAMVGEKVSITSTRPQTTRSVIRGVLTRSTVDGMAQAVLVDTPGLHKPRTALGQRTNAMIDRSLSEADVVVAVLAADEPVGPGDRRVADRAGRAGPPVVCVVNKCDVASPDTVAERLIEASEWDFDAYVPVSALTADGVTIVIDEITARLPAGPLYFAEGEISDQAERAIVAEIVREKFLDRLHDELPHSLVVIVEDMSERPNGTLYVEARVVVERDSQRGIVIGKGGGLLRTAGAEARAELEARMSTPIYLDLRVTVAKDWQQRPDLLDRFGFGAG